MVAGEEEVLQVKEKMSVKETQLARTGFARVGEGRGCHKCQKDRGPGRTLRGR